MIPEFKPENGANVSTPAGNRVYKNRRPSFLEPPAGYLHKNPA
jgi:hypothetical protein